MEDVLRGLRNLGLQAPNPAQLWQLLDDDPQVQDRLVKLLAYNAAVEDGDGEGGSSVASTLMGQDLLQEAVGALLDNFRRAIERQRQFHRREHDTLSVGGGKRVKLPPRKALVARFEAALRKDAEERERGTCFRPRLVYDGLTSFTSKHATLCGLQAVQCADLDQAPKRYEGRYLLCRVASPLLLYVGVSFLVEDVKGALIPVSVSHFTDNLNILSDELAACLPIGTKLAIKEPYLSLDHQARAGPCTGRADVGIRVDSPTDVAVIEDHDANLSGIVWEEPLRDAEKVAGSIRWLRDCGGAGEAQAYYSEKRYGAALRCIQRQRECGSTVDQLLEARIQYAQGAWKAAQEAFQKVCRLHEEPTEEDQTVAESFASHIDDLTPIQAVIRCRLRIAQETQGLHVDDVRDIYFASSNTPRLDTADFVGPVEVQAIEGEGRGLLTTRDVEPGEQLLCCRAISGTYPDDAQSKGSPLLRLNLDNGVVSTTSQVRAQTRLIHAIVDRSELALPILGLTAGPNMAYSDFVSKPYPLRSNGLVEDRATDVAVDAAYIDGVLRFNAFGPAQSPARQNGSAEDFGELSKSTMPHPLPAILNHACLPNVASIFFSDIVTTRALMKLPKGTQIVHQYVRGEEPYAIRAAQLSKHGFTCACQLCVLDRQDGQEALAIRARIVQGELRAVEERSRVLLKRVDLSKLGSKAAFKGTDGLVEASNEDLEAHYDVLGALLRLVDRVNKTYSTQRGPLRPDICVILEIMATHLALTDHEKAIEAVVEAVQSVGGELDVGKKDDRQGFLCHLPRLHIDRIIGLLLLLAVVHTNKEQHELGHLFVRSAFWSHQCMIGGGLDVFKDRWLTAEYRVAITGFTP